MIESVSRRLVLLGLAIIAGCEGRTPAAPGPRPNPDAASSAVTADPITVAPAIPIAPTSADSGAAVPPPPEDREELRVRTLLAGLPKVSVSEAQVCALVGDASFRPPKIVVGFNEDDSLRLVDGTEWEPRRLVPRCVPTAVYGSEVLTPRVDCEPERARCTFWFVSGGRKGTPVPPTERTYWFERRAGKLHMVAVGISHLQ